MCGRTACTLAPDQICRAARHRTANGKQAQPSWRDPPGGQKYYTSYNVSPTSHTPVMLSKKHVKEAAEGERESELSGLEISDYVIQPMHWGLVPSWHKGDPKSIAYKMNNARSDGMLERVSFKRPLEKGRRCVVLVDGYYEWHTHDNGKKQPYFITAEDRTKNPGKSEAKVEVKTEEDSDKDLDKSQEVQVKEEPKDDMDDPPRLLAMAGIFDTWHPQDGDAPLYSYSIITVDAHKSLSFIHHRMPAILNGEDEILAWLNYDTVPLTKAVDLIQSKDCVYYHPVSTLVNNVRNKSEDCVKPIDLSKPEQSKSRDFMAGWLAKAKDSPQKQNVKQEVKGESQTQRNGNEPKAGPSPKKANLMTNWLNQGKSPVKKEQNNREPPNKKPKK